VTPKKSYSTGEAAKQLGVSFRTLQRWIASSKISAVKMPNGRYRIEEPEINRVAGIMNKELEELARIREELVKVIERKKVAYLRELQVFMEYSHLHENTYEALDVLVEKGELNSKSFRGNRWYFSGNLNWKDVESIAIQKKELLDFYVNYPRDFR